MEALKINSMICHFKLYYFDYIYGNKSLTLLNKIARININTIEKHNSILMQVVL